MKNPVYQIRVKPEMLEFLNEAGPEVVRGWWRQRMIGVFPKEQALVVATPMADITKDLVPAAAPEKTSRKKDTEVPSWSKGKVESVEEMPEPAAVVTEAPQMTTMEALRLVAAGRVKLPSSTLEEVVVPMVMKTYQQMPPKVDYDALGDPEPLDDL